MHTKRRGALLAQLVLEGAPRTKKNHGKRISRKTADGKTRTYSVGSDALQLWRERAEWQIRLVQRRQSPIADDVEVTALVYRDAARGDLVGYLQAIGDVLAPYNALAPRILVDDKQIRSWDGSRLLIDRDKPRVELLIRAFAG